jgi:C1A family cysteine protease
MVASYLQRMQRAQSIQQTWNTLRKKDKASLMASLGSDSALAEAALPDTWDSRSVGVVTPPKQQGDCGTWVVCKTLQHYDTCLICIPLSA